MAELAAFQSAFAAVVQGGAPCAGDRGMAVHRNSWVCAAADALASAYPVVAALIGADAFEAVARSYVLSHPPASPVLATYGGAFPAFLSTQPWSQELSYLGDVARIERMRTEAHVARNAEPVEPHALASTEPEAWLELRLPLHPATRFEWLETPGVTIWLAHQKGASNDTIEPEWRPEGALVTRPQAEVDLHPLSEAGHCLLSHLKAGRCVGEAAAQVGSAFSGADIAALFARLLSSGAFLPPVKG